MFRCSAALAALALAAAPALVCAQVQRTFPADALRGRIEFTKPPAVEIEEEAARLAPGVKVRDARNMLILSGALAGRKGVVNYTLDTYGLVNAVWILTDAEAKKLWPRTRAQAKAWTFDPGSQTWTKP
ncbi:MAG: hypothetical protein EPO01_15640 [Aquabacterium sp.]|jgi:hypothetical protein|nr:MAG: hypothetical protein EPO12_16575 [Aquabacterium sp.]TAL18877.1 MAG: hypothetical protein EPO01_15640 [Aquabacterium sp.]